MFDWSELTENTYNKAKSADAEIDDYYGAVRIGECCFDIVVRDFYDGTPTITADLYVGGIDSGYSYRLCDDGSMYPYDFLDGFSFNNKPYPDYDEFIKYAEREFLKYIVLCGNDIIDKANMPLHKW